jgi:proteasome activator subunit 4
VSNFCTNVFFIDLTEEERTICGQSAQFEDFVVQYLDRCFSLINSSSLEETRVEMSSSDHRTTRDESMKDVGMASTTSAILNQVQMGI